MLLGGKPISGKGTFFEPTVIADATPDMLLQNEEVFAPAAALYPFDSEEEAIKMANNSEVGLASCVCTIDIGRMWRVAEKLEVEMIGVNTAALASGELPFDGVKQGGFGSEGGLGRVHDYKTDRCGNFLDMTIFGHWDMRKRGFLGHSEDLVILGWAKSPSFSI